MRSPTRPAETDAPLDELESSGLDLRTLPGNTAKIRLLLDLAAQLREHGRLRVLDVGCAGPQPLELWEPFRPYFDRLELVGVDVAGIEAAAARARELGAPMDVRRGSALALREVGDGDFDAVVSTQVLEHLRAWPDAVRQMAGALRPGGMLYVTCDSGDLRRTLAERVRLAAKRVYARLPVQPGPFSGEWELGPTGDALERAAEDAGLDVVQLTRYALHDVKTAQRHAGAATRRLWLALEETLAAEAGERVDPRLFGIVYLHARRPTA